MMKKSGITLLELLFVVSIFLVVVMLLTPFVNMAKKRSSMIGCEKNLREISLGLRAYAAEHRGEFPKDLSGLYPKYITDQAVFDCPATKAAGVPGQPDYIYTAGLKALSPAKSVMVEDVDGNHGKSGRNLLRVDGSIS